MPKAAGFDVVTLRDATNETVAFQEEMKRRVQTEGPPRLGIHILLGDRFRELMRNSADSLRERRTIVVQCLLRRLE